MEIENDNVQDTTPDEEPSIFIEAHIKIIDPDNGEEILNMRS